MKKKTHYLLAIAVLLVGLVLVACATIDGIYFEQEPRTLYVQGQELDFENTVLMALSGDKSEPLDIQSGEVTISGYDKDKLGEQSVTFTYKEQSTTIKVQVIPRIAVEGVSDEYFVKDLFDKSKGRIKVADDKGNITTVNMSSDLVTIVDFDSETPAEGRLVTVKYGDYTGTFPVDIYEVADVKMSAYPKTKAYDSHDTEFSVLGGYFTVTSPNGEHEKYVELTTDMVKGFDPSAATIEHLNKPLKQNVKLEYLTYSFDFEISITYSAVTMMNDRAEALKNVTDPFAATEAEGLAAWEAIVEYFELAPADKKLITKEVKDHVVRIAAVYGFEKFKTAAEDFKDTIDLVSRVGVIIDEDENEVEKTLGSFVFVAESYEGTSADLERLRDEDEPFVSYAKVLRQIEDEFNYVKVVEGKDMDNYLDIVFSEDGLALVIDALTFLTDLYEEFEDIGEWTVEDLPAYRSEIKRVVVTIRDSAYNPYKYPSYNTLFDLMSQWRENDDYFDIIFAYYLEYERDALVDELWSAVPCPGSLMQLYNALAYGLNATENMRVGSDTTEFMYYYKRALEVAEEIKAENDPLTMEIYELIDFDQLIDNYFFIGNSVDGRAYVYHVSSLFGHEKYGELMTIYLSLLEDMNQTPVDFEDVATQAKIRRMVDIYFAFTPAEQYAFLSALHCDYRYYMMNEYLLSYRVSEDDGRMTAYSWFSYFVFNAYNEMLSEDGFDIFARLMVASEMYALRFRSEDKLAEFKVQMEGIVADLGKLTDADKSVIGDMLDSYILIYNYTVVTPANPDVSQYQETFDALLDAIQRFYEMHILMDGGNNEDAGPNGYFALYDTAYMRARTLLDELIATGDPNVLFVIENVYNIVISGGAAGSESAYSYDFILQEMANAYYSILCKSNITGTDENGEEYHVSAFYLYYDSGLPAFLADAYTLLFKQYDEKGAELDPTYVLSVMEKYRGLSDDAYYVFSAMKGDKFYRDGVKACFKASLSDEAYKVLDLILTAEANYTGYRMDQTESNKTDFKEAVEAMYDAYAKLADKTELAAFADMYQHYLDLSREMA